MPNRAPYLLVALIFAVVISAGLLQRSAVAFYSAQGGDPVMTAVFASAFVSFAVGALVVKHRN